MIRKKYSTLLAVGLCATGLSVCMLNVAQADTAGFSPSGYSLIPGEPTGNDGLFFTPTTAISITSLGYIDCGFSVNHEVGLYDVSTSTLLASATITGSSTFSSDFRYESIAPVLLTAGDEYAVSGFYQPGPGNDTGYDANSSVGANPDITYDGYQYDYNASLDLPTIGYEPPIFGPNFQFVPVPEPASVGCLLLGLGVLVLTRHFRRSEHGHFPTSKTKTIDK